MLRQALLGITLVLPAIFFTGCATTSETSQTEIDIAPQVAIHIPDHQPFGNAANVVQLVHAVYKDRTETFQAIITTQGDTLALVMTLPNGPRIMSFEWRGAKLNSKLEAIAPKGLSAEHMLADIITIYAPADVVRASLNGGELSTRPDGTREISRAGKLLIRVSFPGRSTTNAWIGRAVLENLAFGYRLDISSQPLGQ